MDNLNTYLGGVAVAGDTMKSTSSLWTPNTGIVNTNSSGFTGLPGGYRYYDGTYYNVGNYGTVPGGVLRTTTQAFPGATP